MDMDLDDLMNDAMDDLFAAPPLPPAPTPSKEVDLDSLMDDTLDELMGGKEGGTKKETDLDSMLDDAIDDILPAKAAIPPPSTSLTSCDQCKVVKMVGLYKCSGCGTVAYCGRDCQREAWKAHGSVCKSLREGSSALATAITSSSSSSDDPSGFWDPRMAHVEPSNRKDWSRLLALDVERQRTMAPQRPLSYSYLRGDVAESAKSLIPGVGGSGSGKDKASEVSRVKKVSLDLVLKELITTAVTNSSKPGSDLSWIEKELNGDFNYLPELYKKPVASSVARRLEGDSDFSKDRFKTAATVFMKA